MSYLILSALGIIATLIVSSTWGQKRQLSFILAVIVCGASLLLGIFLILDYTGFIEKGGTSFWAKVPWREIVLYFSMLGGMAAKYMYDWIENAKARKRSFRKWQLFKPMFVSPIIFGTIYGTIDPKTSMILLLVFAFQNGFFWQTILQKQGKQDA